VALNVFISYAHEDQAFRQELDKHLSNLKRQNVITSWYDGIFFLVHNGNHILLITSIVLILFCCW